MDGKMEEIVIFFGKFHQNFVRIFIVAMSKLVQNKITRKLSTFMSILRVLNPLSKISKYL
jgi:hypothetical protein